MDQRTVFGHDRIDEGEIAGDAAEVIQALFRDAVKCSLACLLQMDGAQNAREEELIPYRPAMIMLCSQGDYVLGELSDAESSSITSGAGMYTSDRSVR